MATRAERRAVDVCDAENRQDGTIYDRSGDSRASGGLPMPRSGSPRHQQRLPNENGIPARDSVFDQHDGAPSFRSVRHDSEFRQQQHLQKPVDGGLQASDESSRERDSVDRSGDVLQEAESLHGSDRRWRV